MIYSSRLKKILEYCLERDEYVKVDTLADKLKISSRTVFRELKDVDTDLAEYGCCLESKQGKGLRILGNSEQKEALLKELRIQGIQYLNKEERQNLLLFELLRENQIEKLIHYANLFQVSEATISNDLDSIEPWLEKNQLQLMRKPGLGVEVSGSETNLRRAMTEALNQTLYEHSYENVNFLDPKAVLQQIFLVNEDSIMKLLNQDILVRILQVFAIYQHELNLDRYAQTSYIGLIIHLVIAVDRIIKHEEIEGRNSIVEMIQDDPSYEQAAQMAEYLELEFDIDIPEVEIAFIALHIKGAKTTKVSYGSREHQEQKKLQELIEQILASFDESIAMYLQEDEELYHGLLTHLGPTITRLQSHLPIYNPLLKQIKEEYTQLYAQTRKACNCLFNAFQCDESEDEIGFLTMHIGACLERRKQLVSVPRCVHLGVVCASGIGVSALLSARIQKMFQHEVAISVLSMDDILTQRYSECELLVSTFVIEQIDIEVVITTPLLNEMDIQKLKEALQRVRSKLPIQQTRSEFSCYEQLRLLHDFSNGALHLIQHLEYKRVDASCKIEELISIASNSIGHDIKQIVQLEQELLKREQLGSVVMKDAGFALLHTKSKAIEQSCIQLYYPSQQVFDENQLEFVVVMVLSHLDTHGKQQMMSLFSRSLLEHDEFLDAIRQQHQNQVIELFSTYCMELIDECMQETGE